MLEASDIKCPKCASVEWFPGAACFHCGWEGSAAEACAVMHERVAELEAERDRYRKALEELSVLGGGRSYGNDIAQHALRCAKAEGREVGDEHS